MGISWKNEILCRLEFHVTYTNTIFFIFFCVIAKILWFSIYMKKNNLGPTIIPMSPPSQYQLVNGKVLSNIGLSLLVNISAGMIR